MARTLPTTVLFPSKSCRSRTLTVCWPKLDIPQCRTDFHHHFCSLLGFVVVVLSIQIGLLRLVLQRLQELPSLCSLSCSALQMIECWKSRLRSWHCSHC